MVKFFVKMSFADSTGDAIPFYHEGKYHTFFTYISTGNDRLSGETAYNLEP